MANSTWSGSAATNRTPQSTHRVQADVVRYVNKVGSESGWLLVGLDGQTQRLALHKYCKVLLLGAGEGKTYFKILEGTHKGTIAYLSNSNVDEYLGKTAPNQKPAELVLTYGRYTDWLSISRGRNMPQQLASGVLNEIKFTAGMNTVWGTGFFPIPPGTYTILLPDVPHDKDLTAQYKAEYPGLSLHQVWFPIDYGNKSRYVHVGNVSEGCATVLDLKKWAAIHEQLISHRGSDGKSVGTLFIRGKPERER